jgi:hypothetical protein
MSLRVLDNLQYLAKTPKKSEQIKAPPNPEGPLTETYCRIELGGGGALEQVLWVMAPLNRTLQNKYVPEARKVLLLQFGLKSQLATADDIPESLNKRAVEVERWYRRYA